MKIKMIPTILMLASGAITSIICYILNYEIKVMLFALVMIMAIFYFVGDVIRFYLKKYVFPDETEEEESEENEESSEASEGDGDEETAETDEEGAE